MSTNLKQIKNSIKETVESSLVPRVEKVEDVIEDKPLEVNVTTDNKDVIKAIKEIKLVGNTPLIQAIKGINLPETDLSPLIDAIENSKEELDFSPLIEAINGLKDDRADDRVAELAESRVVPGCSQFLRGCVRGGISSRGLESAPAGPSLGPPAAPFGPASRRSRLSPDARVP